MYVSPLILAARSRCGFWPTKVVGVAGYNSPIAFEDSQCEISVSSMK
jgi:hypothetical protein